MLLLFVYKFVDYNKKACRVTNQTAPCATEFPLFSADAIAVAGVLVCCSS